MTAFETHDLSKVLTELGDLLPDKRDEIAELARRLAGGRLRVLVVGEAKRGKSSLVNALIGRPLLPVGVVPLTSVATVLRPGRRDRLSVHLLQGSVTDHPLSELPRFVTETGNPRNTLGVGEVTIEVPAPILAGGIELVDTPGVGSVYEHNTADATRALARMDAAILVLSADPPISASERQFLRSVREQAVTVICVLNKVDRLTPAELSQALAFTEQVLVEELGTTVKVWPLSTRSPSAPADGAVSASHGEELTIFTDHLRAYLNRSGSDDLLLSISTRTRRLAEEGRAGTELALSALSMDATLLDERMHGHVQQVKVLRAQQVDNAAIAAGRVRELLTGINHSADRLIRDNLQQVRAAAMRGAESTTGADHRRDTEAAALASAAACIRSLVGQWQHEQATLLDHEMTLLHERLSAAVRGQVAAVRAHAGQAFQVVLPPADPLPVPPGRPEPSLSFGEDPGNTTAMLALGRHHLPGAWGRRRVAAHLAERAGDLLDKNVGRTRAELQRRLREAGTGLDRGLGRHADEGVKIISTALDQVRAVRIGDEVARQATRARLEMRRDALAAACEGLPLATDH